MANRHSHKKLRTETLALMAKTGVSYQKAREQLLEREQRLLPRKPDVSERVDLLEATYFGVPVTLVSSASMSTMRVAVALRRPEGGTKGSRLVSPLLRSPSMIC